MKIKLIEQNSDTNKMVAINPKKIKKISLDYQINYTYISKAQLEVIKTRVGRRKYKELLNKLAEIEDILNYEGYAIGSKREEEQTKDIAEIIGKKNCDHLLTKLNDLRGIDQKIEDEVIEILGEKEVIRIFTDLDTQTANISSITFILKNDDIEIKYITKRIFANVIENPNFDENLEDEFKIVQSIFLEDYVKQLCSPNLAETIKPNWEILENAAKRAKE